MGTRKKYQSGDMKVSDKDKEKFYFNNYNPEDLENIIETQHKIIKMLKASNRKKLFSILIAIDDFSDDPSFTRQSKLLHSLFTRGRHTTIVSTQKFAATHPIIRVNATSLIVYRLRNQKELDAMVEEVAGLIGKKELIEIYKIATADEYSFLYVNLAARNVNETVYKNFTGRITLEDIEQ